MTMRLMTPQLARRVLVYALKKALTKEGLQKCLALIATHVESTENKVDDEVFQVFGPAASHVLANSKAGMSIEEYEVLVFEALEDAARATKPEWDDVLVKATMAVAPIVRKGRK